MRTAICSDIHGNYDGLKAVLADISGQKCDRIICLGDLVDGGSQGIEVVRAIRDLRIATVRGNHDETALWDDALPSDVRDFLRSLPEDIPEEDILYTHSSPHPRRRKIVDPIEAWNVFGETGGRRIFVGDVHVPMILGQRGAQRVSAAEYPIAYEEEFALAPDDRYIVCVGAVGYSRDAIPRLRYVIYDSERDTVLFKAPPGTLLAL
jgi:hypothetical protein